MKRLNFAGFLSLVLLLTSCEDVFRENLESKVKLATEALDAPEVSGPDSTSNGKPTWEWTVPDDTVNFRYQLDSDKGIWTETSGIQATSFTPAITLEEGEHAFYVQALGPSGKWSESGSKTTLIDLSAPTVSAGEDISWTNTAVTLNGTCSDRMGITALWEVVPANPEIVFSDTSSLTSTVEGPAGSEGSYSLKLTCTDELGHYATDEVVLNWDTKAPAAGNEGGVSFSDETIDSITLNWTGASDLNKEASDLEYKIVGSTSDNLNTLTECQTTGEGRFTVTDWTAGITSIIAEGLNPSETYYFNILVRDPLKYESLYTKNSYTLNPIPQNVSVLLQPTNKLKISWTAIPGASGYRIYRSSSEAGTYSPVSGDIAGIEYTDEGTPTLQLWWYKVTAYKGTTFESALSNASSGGVFYVSQAGPAGGIIIYRDSLDEYPGFTYLEMAPSDQCSILWDPDPDVNFTYVGASGTAVGTGASNTEAIVNTLGDGTYAAKVCADLVVTYESHDYDDWFLPSKDELTKMYDITLNYDFSSGDYWSSSEVDLSYANYRMLEADYQDKDGKLFSKHVRAIRSF